jgi:hypothetical protein
MKSIRSARPAPGWLAAVALLTLLQPVWAAPPDLQAAIALRPLTPQDIRDHGLAGVQGASGVSAVGIGQPVYLEALVNLAIAPSNIISVTWSLTNKPIGSLAALGDSPLGTNVPPYSMADRLVSQIAGRKLLRPDLAGQYTVAVSIVSSGSGSTNLTQAITAGTYMGLNTCALCHSGSGVGENICVPWAQTPHATFFTRAIDGLEGSHYGKNCIACHTVGHDTNSSAINGGFDDTAAQLAWSFPATLTNGNWATVPSPLKNLANIQCENCHGPGSEHAYTFGKTNVTNWPRIGVSFGAGNCGSCHDSEPNHVRNAEWNNSRHAVATRVPSGASRWACVGCHTAPGFAGRMRGATATNTVYEAISCQACHDPHDATNPHQLRTGPNYTLGNGTAVTNAGSGGFCMECHHSRNGAATNNIVQYQLGQLTWFGGSSFGPHDSPQGDMLEGANAIDYGLSLPSSAHRLAVSNTCVGCHMQSIAPDDPAFTKAGGHTFEMSYSAVTNGVTNTVALTGVCVPCHGPITSFDLKKLDYNGDGLIEGVQTEVQHLLDQLSTLFPAAAYVPGGNYAPDGLVKLKVSVQTNWLTKYLKAAYNWQFVNNDGSKGVHNAPYAVGLLKASIADLNGDANVDGLPDAWQIQYFGSAGSTNAAPNATPAGDGIPNWLKYALGLNPWLPGAVVPDGVVWADGTSLGGDSNSLHIYTAAEVTFDTAVGKTYQVQSVSSLKDGWQNVGAPIAGTGSAISYVMSTRTKPAQFYRVVHSP